MNRLFLYSSVVFLTANLQGMTQDTLSMDLSTDYVNATRGTASASTQQIPRETLSETLLMQQKARELIEDEQAPDEFHENMAGELTLKRQEKLRAEVNQTDFIAVLEVQQQRIDSLLCKLKKELEVTAEDERRYRSSFEQLKQDYMCLLHDEQELVRSGRLDAQDAVFGNEYELSFEQIQRRDDQALSEVLEEEANEIKQIHHCIKSCMSRLEQKSLRIEVLKVQKGIEIIEAKKKHAEILTTIREIDSLLIGLDQKKQGSVAPSVLEEVHSRAIAQAPKPRPDTESKRLCFLL